jgi:hypothetical protein
MLKNTFLKHFNLQLLADGAGAGDGGTGAEGAKGVTAEAAIPQSKGVKNPLANVKYGIQEDAQVTDAQEGQVAQPDDRNARFEELIKGEFKDLYDARVQDTIQKRLKGTKETVEQFEALKPTLEILSKKYGVDASDIKGLNKAIEEDDSYFEEEALQKGLSVEQLKEIRKMERENAQLKAEMEESNRRDSANKLYAKWMGEAEQTQAIYPSFNLEAEMQNPRFLDLLRSNVDVRTAYEVLHKDEIIPAFAQHTAKVVEQKLTNKIIANGARPVENGNSSQSAVITKSDVSQLSKEDRQEIMRRVARGEKIRF